MRRLLKMAAMVSRNAVIASATMITICGVVSAHAAPPVAALDEPPPADARPPAAEPAARSAPPGPATADATPAEPPAAEAAAPAPAAKVEKPAEPFAFADFGWMNGNSRQTDFPINNDVITGTFTIESAYA